MERFFNTTGPCEPGRHFMLPPEARQPGLDRYVKRQLYFSLHAARQTGKTTMMRAFATRLRERGVAAVHATLEAGQGIEDLAHAEWLWLTAIAWAAAPLAPPLRPPPIEPFLTDAPGRRLQTWLGAWCEQVAPTEVVLLLDEADTVAPGPMVSLLRQLRGGFSERPQRAPASVALIGMRDLRDFLLAAKDGVPLNPGSPFNIKQDSLTLRNFSRADVAALYAQHTADTGQAFTEAAVDAAMEVTRGQPFLVNALAQHCVDVLVEDRAISITPEHIQQARELLIRSRTTHLDALRWRLEEPRVRPIIRDILLGEGQVLTDTDDFEYAVDLGLVVRGPDGPEIANPLYREVIGRVLTQSLQDNLARPWWPWQSASGGVDIAALVEAFLVWWRENAEFVRRSSRSAYPEAFPQLAFMAFLQRVVNGGGRVDREYAAGRGRIDLLVSYGEERHALELKRVAPDGPSAQRVEEQGIVQLSAYLETLGLSEGWLIIFDERPGRSWEERLWRREVEVKGRVLHLRGA
jgi:hypothetical protein